MFGSETQLPAVIDVKTYQDMNFQELIDEEKRILALLQNPNNTEVITLHLKEQLMFINKENERRANQSFQTLQQYAVPTIAGGAFTYYLLRNPNFANKRFAYAGGMVVWYLLHKAIKRR